MTYKKKCVILCNETGKFFIPSLLEFSPYLMTISGTCLFHLYESVIMSVEVITMLQAAYMVPHPPIILKEIGKGEEQKIIKTKQAYEQIAKEIAKLRPDTILIFSPHAPSYRNYIAISSGDEAKGDFLQFHASQVSFHERYDKEMIEKIEKLAQKTKIPAGTLGDDAHLLDHGTMVPLYFIEKEYHDFEIVRIGVSDLDVDIQVTFGKCIAEVIKEMNKNIVVIASGDLSHRLKDDGPYGYCEEGPIFDKEIIRIMKENDFDALQTIDPSILKECAQCGLPSFLMLAGILSQFAYRTRFLSYEGTFGVGYAICAIDIEKDPYVALAKMSLEHYVRYHTVLSSDFIPKEMNMPKAVFVSLHIHDRLRGCIGTLSPTKKNIGEEIIANAISAGTRDPRFYAVSKEELHLIEYSIDILDDPKPASRSDDWDVKRYGVIVEDGLHRGVLLPDLEGVDTFEQQLHIALSKAGIDENDDFKVQRFEVIRHHEM